MIQLFNKDKIKVAGLTDYTNLSIEKTLESGDKLLSFSYPKASKFNSYIEEECYIKTKEDEFVIKEKTVQKDYTEFKCVLNLEDLEGKPFENFDSKEQTIDKALALALAGTGWIVGNCSLLKKRTVRISNCSSLEVIREIKKVYRCDLVFNTLTKTIDVHEHLGKDKGTYFIDSLNLKSLAIQGNSYDYFTRIIPIGKDNLRITSINDGKEYVENYQYSKKIKTTYWPDDRYTNVASLKEDAEAKLKEISKPYRSYSTEIINLAKISEKYKNILDYKLGDTIYLISKKNKFRDKQRIVKIIEHPNQHELDSIELANTTLTFEDIQTQFQEATETINNITTDNGTVDGSKINSIKTEQISDFSVRVAEITDLIAINADITNLKAHNVTITGQLTSVQANIGTIIANVATIDKLTVTHSAYISDLQANKASITQLNAVNATIQIVEAEVGKIETLVNGNLTSKNIQARSITARELAAGTITAGSGVIADGAIGNAQISNLDAIKINAGTIDTSLVTIAGPNGNLKLRGNRLQVFQGLGNNQVERVSLGDVLGDGSRYGLLVRGADGKTVIIDENGVTSAGITNGLITNDKINGNANIDGAKLNINSVVTSINGATTTIHGTKIDINGTNLAIKLSQQDTTISEHKNTLISHTTSIAANTNAIRLKVDETVYNSEMFDMKEKYKDVREKQQKTDEKINTEVSDLTTSLGELSNYLNNEFKDGVLNKQEIENLKGYLINLEKEKSDVLAQTEIIEKYPELSGCAELVSLVNARVIFSNTHKLLIDNINSMINDYQETDLKIHFIKSKNTGDCILIQTDNGKNILVDSNEKASASINIDYMKRVGVKNLDYIFVTHHHSDHCGGMPDIMDSFTLNECKAYYEIPDWSKLPPIETTEWKSNEVCNIFVNTCKAKGVQSIFPTEKQKIVISNNTYIEIYNTKNTAYSDYNALSLVLLLVHKNKRFLLTGDINKDAETKLLGKIGKVDFVKANHHDYYSKGDDNFLKELNFKDAVITRIERNAENRLMQFSGFCQYHEKDYYAQYDSGTIILTSDGTNYSISAKEKSLYRNAWFDSQGLGKWYYFKADGKYARNESLVIEGKTYNFREDGLCTNA